MEARPHLGHWAHTRTLNFILGYLVSPPPAGRDPAAPSQDFFRRSIGEPAFSLLA